MIMAKIYFQKFSSFYNRPTSVVCSINFPENPKYKGDISVGTDIQYNPLFDFLEALEKHGPRHLESNLPKIKKFLKSDGFVEVKEPIYDYFGETEKIKKIIFKGKKEFLETVETWRGYTG
jgi:hypothetical protein